MGSEISFMCFVSIFVVHNFLNALLAWFSKIVKGRKYL